MTSKTKYQMRVRKDLTDTAIHQSAMKCLGAVLVSEISTFTVTLPSIQAVIEKTATIENLKEYEIISIVLIDTDNSDLLGDDFDWDEVES